MAVRPIDGGGKYINCQEHNHSTVHSILSRAGMTLRWVYMPKPLCPSCQNSPICCFFSPIPWECAWWTSRDRTSSTLCIYSDAYMSKGHIQSNKQCKLTQEQAGKSVTSIMGLSCTNQLKVNLIFLCGGTTGLVDKESPAEVMYLDISMGFESFSRKGSWKQKRKPKNNLDAVPMGILPAF